MLNTDKVSIFPKDEFDLTILSSAARYQISRIEHLAQGNPSTIPYYADWKELQELICELQNEERHFSIDRKRSAALCGALRSFGFDFELEDWESAERFRLHLEFLENLHFLQS